MIRVQRTLAAVLLGASVVFLWGCAGMEYVPGGRFFFYHKELPESQRAIDAARKAGKDKECPADFQAAEKMKNDAYALYYACHTKEAIAKAKEAMALAASLCPRPVETPKPAPAPPAARPRILSFSASPSSVRAGDCSTLNWSTTGATGASIDAGIGSVETSGSRRVCPDGTTHYTLTASAAGESDSESATIDVTAAPAPAPIDRMSVHVNFDTDKSEIRKADHDELEKALHFVEKYPGCKISVEGHTDSTGSEAYNQALSERRAAAVKKFLIDHGVTSADRIESVGYGETRPIADNTTAKGRSENRRVEIVIVSR
ncbi:MAG TPA: OmpA family protein [Thermoanaerobaculia bacterium]|nr:OmpA family protein [Thermoanaerobaculia bacterium]